MVRSDGEPVAKELMSVDDEYTGERSDAPAALLLSTVVTRPCYT